MCYFSRHLFRKTMALVLTFTVLLSLMPVTAFADLNTTKDNTSTENQSILEALQELYGDETSAEQALKELNRLGLLDGEEWVTSTIELNGEQLTLEQVRELAFAQNADLNQTVTIAGTTLTLGNLRTMIEIEDEIERIRNTYFSDVTLTEVQQQSLDSLTTQIETQGIQIMSQGGDGLVFPSGINHDIYVEVDTTAMQVNAGSGQQSVTLTLKDSTGTLAAVPNYDITVPYRFVDGSATHWEDYYPLPEGLLEYRVKFEANSSETSKTIDFGIELGFSRFNNAKSFLIQYYNPTNVLLAGGKRAAETVVSIVNHDFAWDQTGEPTFSFSEQQMNTFIGPIHRNITLDEKWLPAFDEGLYNRVQLELTGSLHTDETVPIVGMNGKQYVFPEITQEINHHKDTYVPYIEQVLYQAGTIVNDIIDFSFDVDYSASITSANVTSSVDATSSEGSTSSVTIAAEPTPVPTTAWVNGTVTFKDAANPVVEAVSIPTNHVFEYGHSIPIVVEYSEPVAVEHATAMVNGKTITAAESNLATTKLATFLYSVKEVDGASATFSWVDGAHDIYSNAQNRYEQTHAGTNIIKGIQKADAFATVNAEVALNNTKTKMAGTVTLNLVDSVPEWVTSEADLTTGEVASIYASINGDDSSTKISLFVDDLDNPTKLVGNFEEELNTTGADITKVVEFYLDPEINSSTNHEIMIGKYTPYTIPPVVFLKESDFSIAYNSFPSEPIFAEDKIALSLGVDLQAGVDATWKDPEDFEWQSNNTDVATIAENGTISLTGVAGSVTFTLITKNGGVDGKAISLESLALDVRAGLTPFLQIPTNSNVIMIRQGDEAQVRWTSNLIAKNAEEGNDTEFTIEMYVADYTTGTLQRGELVYSQIVIGNNENPVASHSIPAGSITQVSALPQHSYIVDVSSEDQVSGNTLMASAYINVLSQPAVVRLQPLDNYYITDSTTSVPVRWTLDHFDVLNDAEFELEIKNNADGSTLYTQIVTENQGGIYDLSIPPVTNGFRDVYTVSVKAKNAAEPTWSYDSFVLYVYSNTALQLWIDGTAAGSEHMMSNVVEISQMTSAQILALERDIHLKNIISINFGDYAWGQIRDQIRWQASDSSVASVNYRQGNLYENIENFAYTSYRPATEFILSGLKDGIAQVTATHAATGLEQTVEVQVETLKDKLYLMQVYPKAKTTLTYSNGTGQERRVETNETGALALYEESGINSKIYLQSIFGGREYQGTLYQDSLVSSEKDSTKLELYPQNNFKLREVATVNLYFKQPNGQPYTGEVILRGGVYKNGSYCQEALLNGISGEVDQTISTDTKGTFTVQMDASQFWTESNAEVLQPQDKLQFIYEVRFPNGNYYPQLLTIDGNLNVNETVHFGLSTVSLRTVNESEKNKPFVESQHAKVNAYKPVMDTGTFTGKMGPSQNAEEVVLTTRVLWWGEAGDDAQGLHNLVFEDQFGTVPQGQQVEMIDYPFSTIKNSFQTFTLNKNAMQGWLQPGEQRNLTLKVIDGEGDPYRKIPMPFSIVNMLGAERVEKSSNLQFMLQTLTSTSAADAQSLAMSDTLLNKGINKLKGQGMEGEMFSMVISPTTDPTVFKALIQLGVKDNMAYDSDESSKLNVTPSASDTSDMAGGNYFVSQTDELAHNKDHVAAKRSRDVHYALGAYLEAEIGYNFDKQTWEIFILNGSLNAGGGVSYTWNYNTWVGPVPVTGQLRVGATIEGTLKIASQRNEQIQITYNKEAVNDYLTNLRMYAYFRAFAGFGVDYTVAALKIGMFGQVSLDAQFAFLNQPYRSSDTRMGQLLGIKGKVGIEFVAKFLFVSYEKILASLDFMNFEWAFGDWNRIHAEWGNIGMSSSNETEGVRLQALAMPNGSALYPIAERAIMEERNYLEQFNRSWVTPGRFSVMSLDSASEVEELETNSYPYANPVLSDDGQLLVYISDADSSEVEDTEVRFTQLVASASGANYPNGTAIEPGGAGFGDSQLKLAGTKDFAAAAWVRQSEGLTKEAGEEITGTDVALMTNSTEIMVGVYNGTEWTTQALTNNASPDLAPAVATNGNKVLVAWRSVYATDADDPLNFSGIDRILYSIYETGNWSDPETLYNGTSGAIKGLDAAMLDDGTTAITYAVDTIGSDFVLANNANEVESNMEIVYALVDEQGEVADNVRVTNDSYLDQNPQLTTTTFADQNEWFVLGWHSLHDVDGVSANDIRLRAFDNEGLLHSDFIDSISSVYDVTDVDISANFRFTRNAATLEDLSLMWAESANTGDIDDHSFGADKDVLKAVKFCSDNGSVHTTAALAVAEMPDFTLVNHFDAYLADDNTVKAVILGTNYANGFEPTGMIVQQKGQLNDVVLPTRVSNLYTASASYENTIDLSLLTVDYESVVRGMQIPVQFRVQNTGIQPISGITIDVDDNTNVFDELHLLPNESVMLTAYYDIPADAVVNPPYTITAAFDLGDGDMETDVLTGNVYLAIPDVGISKLESLSEENGERLMQVTLYNNSDVQLAGSNRVVKIGFYDDADLTNEVMPVVTVDTEDDLALLDAGAYTKQITFNIANYVGEGNEIPVGGVLLYTKAWIEEPLPDGSGETGEILEYYRGNNQKSILFESLVERNDGQLATISTEQLHAADATTARVTVKNNSLVQTSSGNLVVRLWDENGQELEALQSYEAQAANNGLIELGPEAVTEQEFTFTQPGAEVTVAYANAVLTDATNAKLGTLSLSEVPLQFDPEVNQYTANIQKMSSTLVSAVAEDPNATASVNNTGLSSARVNLSAGRNIIKVNVTAADGVTTATYTVIVNTPSRRNPSPSPAYNVNRQTDEDGQVTAVIKLSSWSIGRLGENDDSVVTLDVTDKVQDDEKIQIDLEDSALSQLVASENDLHIKTGLGEMVLPLALIETLADQGQPITIELTQLINDDVTDEIEADEEVLDAADIKTNYTGTTVLRFPVSEGLNENDLTSVMFKVKHSDGTTEWIKPAILTDEAGDKYLEFVVDHFSTFIMYKATEPATLESVVVIGDTALDLDCLFITEELHTVETLVNNLIMEQGLAMHDLWWRAVGGDFMNIGDESLVGEDEILGSITKYINPELETIRIYHRE